MLLSEYTMERRSPSGTRDEVKRVIFTVGRRIIGTETATTEWFEGELRGWGHVSRDTDTKQFPTQFEAVAWINDLHAFDDLDRVQGLGGTKAIATV